MRRRDRERLLAAAAAGLGLAVLAHTGASVTRGSLAPVPARVAAAPADPPANVALGERMAAARGWTGGQWSCLYALWNRESGWDVLATYPSHDTPPSARSSSITTAYGIPQALHARDLASAGPDWRTDPATQIRWGLGYIAGRYRTPCGAWAHEQADGWY